MVRSGDNTVGVIIPTHNHLDYAEKAVRSLLREPTAVALVIDDASSEWSDQFELKLQALDHERVLIDRFSKQGGLTRSWNHGLKLARENGYRFAVCANSDVIFSAGWWPPVANALTTIPNSFVGPLSNAPGTAKGQRVTRYLPDYELTDDLDAVDATGSELHDRYGDDAFAAESLNGFCFCGLTLRFWEHQFDTTHVFNPAKKLTGNEDEFFKRAKRNGAQQFIAPVFVFHYRGITRGTRNNASRGLFRPVRAATQQPGKPRQRRRLK